MDKPFLNKLMGTHSVSGFENEISRVFSEELADSVSEIKVDVMGNTYAYVNSIGSTNTILIEAHCDEIGFQVINVSESGFVYIRRNGGIDEQCVPGLQVIIKTVGGEYINGVIGKKPIHLMNTDDRKRTLELNQVWVDTGLSKQEVIDKISIGDTVSVSPNFQFLGASRITGKALDNKIGVYIVTEVLKRISKHTDLKSNVVGVASVQEEVGSRGAAIVAYNVKPDIAITIDVDFATDVPDLSPNRYGKIDLGRGVIIPRNVDISQQLSKQFENMAKVNNILYQVSARPHATGGTNISHIQTVRNGIMTMSLGIPCRYMHTPVEMCDMKDVDACIELLYLWILSHK